MDKYLSITMCAMFLLCALPFSVRAQATLHEGLYEDFPLTMPDSAPDMNRMFDRGMCKHVTNKSKTEAQKRAYAGKEIVGEGCTNNARNFAVYRYILVDDNSAHLLVLIIGDVTTPEKCWMDAALRPLVGLGLDNAKEEDVEMFQEHIGDALEEENPLICLRFVKS